MFGMIHPSTFEPLTTKERERVVIARDNEMAAVITIDGSSHLFFVPSYEAAREAAESAHQWTWTPIENFFREAPTPQKRMLTEEERAAYRNFRIQEQRAFDNGTPEIFAEKNKHFYGY